MITANLKNIIQVFGRYLIPSAMVNNGNLLYVAINDGDFSLWYIFVINTITGDIISEIPIETPGDVYSLIIYNRRLYIQCGTSIQIFDISHGEIPVHVNTINQGTLGGQQRNILSDGGGRIYSVGVYFFSYDADINPGSLNVLEQVLLDYPCHDSVSYNLDKIFGISANNLIYILDVSNKINMVFGSFAATGLLFEVVPSVLNDYIYVFSRYPTEVDSSLFVYRINNGEFIFTNSLLMSIGEHGNVTPIGKMFTSLLFLVDYNNQVFYVIDMKNPMSINVEALYVDPLYEYWVDFIINEKCNMAIMLNYTGTENIIFIMDIFGVEPKSKGVPRLSNMSRYLTFGKGELN